MRTRIVLGLLAMCALVCACHDVDPRVERNLLFVVLDTTRADHLSAYGYAQATTPRLAQLSESGTRFDGVRSTSSLTPVSAASFLTGQLPIETGIRSLFVIEGKTLQAGVKPLAELMSESGRRLGGFVSAPPLGSRYGFDRGFEVFDDDVKANAVQLRSQKVGNAYQRRSDQTTDRALEWLATIQSDQAFGLFVHYFDAHDPSLVPPRDFLAPRVSFDLPEDLDQRRHLDELFDGAERGRGGARAADLIELYDAEIEYMDQQFGRLLDALEVAGRLKNTVVVVLADHGESLGQHDFWTHGLMWDEELHVPLVLAGPGVPSGLEVPESAGTVDLLPTLADLLGFEVPRDIHGQSLTPLFDAQASWNPKPVFSEVHNSPQDKAGRPAAQFAVTAWPWKLIIEPGAEPLLFNLENDPGELRNIHSDEGQIARALGAALGASGLMDATAGGLVNLEDLDPEERAVLEKLGYL